MSFVGGCCHLHKGENHGIHNCRLPLAKRHHACVQLLGWAKPNLRNCVHAPRRRCWVWFVRQVFSWDAKRLRPHHQPSGNFCRVLPCQSDVAWHNHHKTISIVHQVALKIFSKQKVVYHASGGKASVGYEPTTFVQKGIGQKYATWRTNNV